MEMPSIAAPLALISAAFSTDIREEEKEYDDTEDELYEYIDTKDT